MLEALIDNLEKFQTIVVGLLGFAGVITTISMNGRLARRQHERQQAHERETLRTALCAELEVICQMLINRRQSLSEHKPGQSALIPAYVPDHVYRQLLGRIGLLSSTEVGSVIRAYLLVGEMPQRLRLLEETTAAATDSPDYIRVSAEHAQHAATLHDNFLKSANLALENVKAALRDSARTNPG